MNNPIHESLKGDPRILSTLEATEGRVIKKTYDSRTNRNYDGDLVVIEFEDGTFIFLNSVLEYDVSWVEVEFDVNKYYAAKVGLYDPILLESEVKAYKEYQEKTRLLTKEKENKEILDKLAANPELLKMAKSRFNF